jgi:hypothetical protein
MKVGELLIQSGMGKSARPYVKNKLKAKRTGRTGSMAQVEQYLLSKCSVLSSSFTTAGKKK